MVTKTESAPDEGAEQPVGLSDEESQRAIDLFAKWQGLVGNRIDRQYIEKTDCSTIAWLCGPVRNYLELRAIENARQAGRAHYEAQKGAYHEQALLDAETNGYDIDFDGGVVEWLRVRPEG